MGQSIPSILSFLVVADGPRGARFFFFIMSSLRLEHITHIWRLPCLTIIHTCTIVALSISFSYKSYSTYSKIYSKAIIIVFQFQTISNWAFFPWGCLKKWISWSWKNVLVSPYRCWAREVPSYIDRSSVATTTCHSTWRPVILFYLLYHVSEYIYFYFQILLA